MKWGEDGKLRFTIIGQPCSMKNGRSIGYKWSQRLKRQAPFIRKSDKALAYEQSIKMQIRPLPRRITGPCKIWIRVFYGSKRPDLDCELIFDALQDRIYENDRQLVEKHLYHAIDKQNPRAEVVIEPLAPELI